MKKPADCQGMERLCSVLGQKPGCEIPAPYSSWANWLGSSTSVYVSMNGIWSTTSRLPGAKERERPRAVRAGICVFLWERVARE